jgi:hypothetical protein
MLSRRSSTVIRSAINRNTKCSIASSSLRQYHEKSDFQKDVIFTTQTGVDLLHDPLLNKGTAFSPSERDRLGLRGLLPPRVKDFIIQIERLRRRFDAIATDIDKYVFLCQLQDRNEVLFYRFLSSYIKESAPIM